MAFPTIPTVAASRILFTLNTAGGATKTFPSLTTLAQSNGDLLIAIIVEYDGNSTNAEFSSWGGGFTEFADQAGTATMAIGAAYKFSDGTETGTFTVTTADTSANDSVMILMAIPGAHRSTPPEAGTMVTGTAPDSGSLNPTGWGTEDTLWIVVGGSGEDATTGSFTGVATAPTNYTASQADSGITADVVGGVEASVGFRQLNAASEDPGAWSLDTSNARGASLLIAVRPVPEHLIVSDFPLGLTIDSNLIVSTPAVEHFITSDFPLSLIVDSNFTVEKLISSDFSLSLAIDTDLTVETPSSPPPTIPDTQIYFPVNPRSPF